MHGYRMPAGLRDANATYHVGVLDHPEKSFREPRQCSLLGYYSSIIEGVRRYCGVGVVAKNAGQPVAEESRVSLPSPMPYMWADTLLAAERGHLLRVMVWGGVSVLLGTAIIAWLRVRSIHSPLLLHFGAQNIGWGVLDGATATIAFRVVAVRDLAGATRLDRFLWLNIGLDAGYVLVGITLILLGWRTVRRPGLVGAGMGVVTQGGALALLDIMLATLISR